MTDLDVRILLGPTVKTTFVVPAAVGITVDLNVSLSESIKDQRVRFSFMTERGVSVCFDTTKSGQIIVPIGVAHHMQTVVIPWYVVRPIESNDAVEIGVGESMAHRYKAIDGANVANSKFVRDWAGESGISEVVFVFNK